MTAMIDTHREEHGVEPICKALQVAPSTYYAAKAREQEPSARSVRDEVLTREIKRVHAKSRSLYGARKVWLQLHREGIDIARCTTERLMKKAGLEGVRRGKRRRTTIPEQAAARPEDLVKRNFKAHEPNRIWVSDFTYVPTWLGVCYVAFAIDAYSRRIVGWKADRQMKTDLVLDTLDMALFARDHEGMPVLEGELIKQHDAGSQYTSFAFTQRLLEAGIDDSVGSIGDAYDNALAETTIGLYKTELIERLGPWKSMEQVELATLEWVDWFNHQRLHGACGDRPPVEFEQLTRNTDRQLVSHTK